MDSSKDVSGTRKNADHSAGARTSLRLHPGDPKQPRVPDASTPAPCWGITEGAAGMVSQVKGLAQALGLPYELQTTTLRLPWKKLWPGLIPVRSQIFTDARPLLEGSPRVAISCGRQAIMASLFLKKRLGDAVFTVHIQDPRIDTQRFDLVLAPEHDGLNGPNVFHTRGAIHHINHGVLQAAALAGPIGPLGRLSDPFVTVLLGGPNHCFKFDVTELIPLVALLRRIARQGVSLCILPSRRTPTAVVEQFSRAFGHEHFVWDRTGENPYLAALALCSHVIVTCDSVSMISEAAATEKPVYVFALPERRRSARFRRFHESFAAAGITRPFAGRLESWTYPSPNVTDQVAQLIRNQIGDCYVASSRPAA